LEIERLENGDFAVGELEPTLVGILLALPSSTEPGESDAARHRLFPELTAEPETTAMREEWKEYVVPDLERLFHDATEIARRDLTPLEDGEREFTIPLRNVDAWISTLNQAMLVLGARFDIDERDMEKPQSAILEDERGLALFQIHFYSFLQECLIRGIESLE